MFNGSSNEADCGAGHHTCHCMAYRGEFMELRVWEGEVALCEGGGGGGHSVGVEEGAMQEFAVVGQGAEHKAVHEHPSYERRCRAFVEAGYAFFPDGLEEALEGPREAC